MNERILYFKSVKIITTFFLLWITTQFEIAIENMLAYVFILSIGILHGSNDIKLIHRTKSEKNVDFKSNLLRYIGVVILSVITFILLPKLALAIFLIFSAYHFGEQHLISKVKKGSLWITLFFIFYGFVIFLLIFYTNAEATSTIIYDMSAIGISKRQFYFGLLTSLALLSLIFLILFKEGVVKLKLWEELLYLALFYITFSNATLLWSFAIYFIIWHAIPSLLDQIKVLYGNVSKLNLRLYLKSSILYWAVSVLGIYLIHNFTQGNERLFNQLFFSFIAAITFPHVLVMGKMFGTTENNKNT